MAAAPSQRVPGRLQVAAAGFADAQLLTQSASEAQPHPAVAAFDPVEILSKPNPVYTEEARRLHVQGEVLLRVVFAASGKLQILGVAEGLGHGLDQAAIQAAQQIEFKPARRNVASRWIQAPRSTYCLSWRHNPRREVSDVSCK